MQNYIIRYVEDLKARIEPTGCSIAKAIEAELPKYEDARLLKLRDAGIDLVRIVTAAQLLGNPALELADVVHVLHFASQSHLTRTARRITGQGATELARLGPKGVLTGFLRGKTRSRSA